MLFVVILVHHRHLQYCDFTDQETQITHKMIQDKWENKLFDRKNSELDMFLCEMDYRLKKNTVALIHSQREMSVFDLGTETFQGFFMH